MKNAVILCGPPRFYKQVILKIKKYDNAADIFLFLWKDDSGSKRRSLSDHIDLDFISKNCTSFTIQSSLNNLRVDELKINFDKDQSLPMNVIGMFYSINVCLKSVEASLTTYDRIYRIRTDMILLRNIFKDKLANNKVLYLSKNYIIRKSYISDHLMVGKLEVMKKLWCFHTAADLIDELRIHNNNPEKLLKSRVANRKVQTKRYFERYTDYQIFYNPFVKHDPSWVKPKNISRAIIKLLFDVDFSDLKISDKNDIYLLLEKQKSTQAYYENRSLLKKITDKVIKYFKIKILFEKKIFKK